jgi:hypothetical protein
MGIHFDGIHTESEGACERRKGVLGKETGASPMPDDIKIPRWALRLLSCSNVAHRLKNFDVPLIVSFDLSYFPDRSIMRRSFAGPFIHVEESPRIFNYTPNECDNSKRQSYLLATIKSGQLDKNPQEAGWP